MSNWRAFSKKQKTVLTWWCPGSPYARRDAIICDGAVRSGKTLCMSLSFVLWMFAAFHGQAFAMCGKSLNSLRRNVIRPLVGHLEGLGFTCREKISKNMVEISRGGRSNTVYFFGGKDESSAASIQGMTLAGVMFDEVALMPRSFVEQALARCSVPGSKFWFNCNPEHPWHWFYREWIKKVKEKNALYLHFVMEDNPSLSPGIRRRYESLYAGPFYERFVKGKWTAASGRVYPMFDEGVHVVKDLPREYEQYAVSCDYGTVNPTSMGLWGKKDGVWYRIREYYYDSRAKGSHKTDEEYYAALVELAGDRPIQAVVVDPSAASFIECIRRHGKFPVIPAKNDVVAGIRRVGDLLKERKLLFSPACKDTFREFSLYCWDERAGKDAPKKENDHAMDDIRYFVSTIASEEEKDGFFVLSVDHKEEKVWDFG